MSALHVVRGGLGAGPPVVLLHGMSGNAGVWSDLVPLLDRRWLALDLPGHGRSPTLSAYDYDTYARAVARILPAEQVLVLGHSLGGAIGLRLAALHPVAGVVSVGLRAGWPPEFVATLAALGAKPQRTFPDRAAAAAFLLRINGLGQLQDGGRELVDRGLVGGEGGWRLAQDPPSYAVGPPPFDALLADTVAAGTPVTLAHGDRDQMVAVGDYDGLAERYGVTVHVLQGVGHNPHVEAPAAVVRLLPS